MIVYIQQKEALSNKVWEQIPQDKVTVMSESVARGFCKSLAKHLKKDVRMTVNHPNGNGNYFSYKML